MGIEIGGYIEKVDGKDLKYSEFVEKYLFKNQPVVLTGIMDDWGACKDWVTDNGHPNLRFFETCFGKSKVQVADCGTREFTDQKRLEMSVSEFVSQWRPNSAEEQTDDSTCDTNGKSTLYLKDWHFVKEYPEYLAYRTPLFFCDDWLNIYLDNYRLHKNSDICQENNEISCSDYRFVYMGAKGSWTPLHADVFRSYSWSANICGKKNWFFLPPNQSHLVFDRNMKNCVFNLFEDINETMFPGFKKATWLECVQERDEIIFVPSGWYHQVHNLEDTISINHNWFNAYNISWVWDLLWRDYEETNGYIEDMKDICEDFEALCQRNLAANTGMNFYDFFIFILQFSLANVVQLHNLYKNYEHPILFSHVGQNLALNLVSIQKILLKMKSIDGLPENKSNVDLREVLDDPDFLKLCTSLDRTYSMIHEEQHRSFDAKDTLMVKLGDHSQISSIEDLISFIDHAVSEYCGTKETL
ncbi:jmjC domain-containing protein 4 isoform X2 [Carica papaya]|uniref:jmjC domain-containing protein 4 isoform X2 n=1 Tax=Carica papaya TaxID=3649 RepID=UPI000B8D1145|nr:jmjC domain-containing protein 4 isoform X2 [Carica papaya]